MEQWEAPVEATCRYEDGIYCASAVLPTRARPHHRVECWGGTRDKAWKSLEDEVRKWRAERARDAAEPVETRAL